MWGTTRTTGANDWRPSSTLSRSQTRSPLNQHHPDQQIPGENEHFAYRPISALMGVIVSNDFGIWG